MTTLVLTSAEPTATLTTPTGDNVAIQIAGASDAAVLFDGPGAYHISSISDPDGSPYTITATDGAVVTVNGLNGPATLAVDGSSAIALGLGISPLAAISVAFTGSGSGTLVIDPTLLGTLAVSPVISGFGPADHIELGGAGLIGYTSQYDGATGTLSLLRSGNVVGSVKLVGSYSSANFSIGTDDTGHTAINYVACFLRGTRIATPAGPVAIEDLAIGDLVLAASGRARPVRWIGRRSYNPLFTRRNPQELLPVLIRQGALAENVPSRDLYVSPRHAMAFEGVLIHAIELVNGRTILQEPSDRPVDYLHLELDSHDIILAEDAPTESYTDTGNRHIFHNAAEFGGEAPAAGFCAPLVNGTPIAAAARARLAARAGLPPAQEQAAGPLAGYVDRASDGIVSGWAMDEAEPERPVRLEVLVDGRVVGRPVADIHRADLVVNGSVARHGFEFRLPQGLAALTTLTVRRAADGAVLKRATHEDAAPPLAAAA